MIHLNHAAIDSWHRKRRGEKRERERERERRREERERESTVERETERGLEKREREREREIKSVVRREISSQRRFLSKNDVTQIHTFARTHVLLLHPKCDFCVLF